MAEDLDAELDSYWKGAENDDAPSRPEPAGKRQVQKRIISLTGKKRGATANVPKSVPTPSKPERKVISLKANPKKIIQGKMIDKALTNSAPSGNSKFNKAKRQKNANFKKHNFQFNSGNRSGNPFHPQVLARLEPRPDPATVVYPGKTKLFIGGLSESYTQTELEELLEPYGELQECYLPQGKGFAIVTFTSREAAYKAQRNLSGETLEGGNGKTLRVRPSPDAAVWVGDLPSIATNELLKQAFSRFGPINRAIVCCDTRGRSLGYGVVEFAYKGSATNCIEVCTTQPFLLSRSPQPVRVEPYRYKETDIGLPAKEMLIDRFYWQMIQSECNGPGPRLMEDNDPIAQAWLNLYQQQKIAKQALKEKFLEERKELMEKQQRWFEEEEEERARQTEEVRSQRMEIMRREQNLRSSQAQLSHASAQVGFGAW